MKSVLQRMTLLAIITITFSACYSAVESTLHSGDYEQALQEALKRLDNKRKRDDYIAIAEKAYRNVLNREQNEIDLLKSRYDNANWGRIYNVYRKMEYRQKLVEPYLPITYTDGREADFPTYNYGRVKEEARENAAAYHYDRAIELLASEYKEHAREAYFELDKIDRYYNNYKDKVQLKYIAKQKGTNQVLLKFKNNDRLVLPSNFFQELQAYNYEKRLEDWTQLHRTPTDSMQYDMTIEVQVQHIEFTPERIREVRYTEQERVRDGNQPKVNSEGQYVTDTLGNILQEPRYVTLYCYVTEYVQEKSGRLFSSFTVQDNRNNKVIVEHRMEDNTNFSNVYAQANGHLDILDYDTRRKLNQRPLPFPSDFDMIMQTTQNLKYQIAQAFDRYDDVLASL